MGCGNDPISLEAVLGAEKAVLDTELKTSRALQPACVIVAICPQALSVRGRVFYFVRHSNIELLCDNKNRGIGAAQSSQRRSGHCGVHRDDHPAEAKIGLANLITYA